MGDREDSNLGRQFHEHRGVRKSRQQCASDVQVRRNTEQARECGMARLDGSERYFKLAQKLFAQAFSLRLVLGRRL